MKRYLRFAKKAAVKSVDSIKADGLLGFTKRSAKFVYYKKYPEKKKHDYKDILFINGCTLPHPERYRVYHQMEQLMAHGMSVDSVFYEQLDPDMLRRYRGFVFFRCPITDTVRDFIKQAKEYNKTCFFDIDDLVIDQKYTDQIEYVKNMPASEKAHYDDGVNRMRETLELCDYAITSTERLATELKSYTSEVFVNRNVASDEMIRYALRASAHTQRDDSKVIMGYFSGSITHNEDFELILPSIVRLLEKHDNLYLKIVGILDIPAELEPFKDRLIAINFMDWRQMPKEVASCDINLAPLTNTIFNEAKSENKWTEAALVKVVTVASSVGAFKIVVKHNETGVLVDNDWFTVLDELITDKDRRNAIAERAYKEVLANHTTVNTRYDLAGFVRSKLARNIGFVLPSTDISGGIIVALKHADILRRHGWDVTLIDAIDKSTLRKSQKQYDYRQDVPGFNVITDHKANIEAYFDTLVATLWSTLKDVKAYPNVANRLYFVQNFETDFYVPGTGEARFLANASYCDTTNVRYVTMSLWCKDWLKQRFGKDAKYASNGIDLHFYPHKERDFKKGKIKILVEGDSQSEYKNTDEAFRIIEKLDPKRYEISYLSYRKEPKSWYRVDHFYNRIPPEKVGEVYASCDILIKTSLLESFSYPPLEMMATGGVSVVLPNGGNREYLRDGENCLFYEAGNIDDGVRKVEAVVADSKLRNKLIAGGLKTAKAYTWKNMEKDILALYK